MGILFCPILFGPVDNAHANDVISNAKLTHILKALALCKTIWYVQMSVEVFYYSQRQCNHAQLFKMCAKLTLWVWVLILLTNKMFLNYCLYKHKRFMIFGTSCPVYVETCVLKLAFWNMWNDILVTAFDGELNYIPELKFSSCCKVEVTIETSFYSESWMNRAFTICMIWVYFCKSTLEEVTLLCIISLWKILCNIHKIHHCLM